MEINSSGWWRPAEDKKGKFREPKWEEYKETGESPTASSQAAGVCNKIETPNNAHIHQPAIPKSQPAVPVQSLATPPRGDAPANQIECIVLCDSEVFYTPLPL